MKLDNFYSLSEAKAGIKGSDNEKNFPSVPRPARRIVKDQQTCFADYSEGSKHQGAVSMKKKTAF